jgi:hypothetical protein
MTNAGSQTSGVWLALLGVVAGIGGVFFLFTGGEAQGPAVASSAPERPTGEPFETDLEFAREPPPPQPPPEVGLAEVQPRDVAWLASLPRAETFGAQSFSPRSTRDGEPLALRWTMVDEGPARDDDGGLLDEGNRDRRYALDVTWNGETRTVPLNTSYGYPDAAQTSFCERRGWRYVEQGVPMQAVSPYAKVSAHLPELGVFAEGNFRGDNVYRVLATPHAIHVLMQDTSPSDWIRTCRTVHQGPFTECYETRWFLLATLAVDLPREVEVSETVTLTEDDGTGSIACDAVGLLFEALAP